MLMTACRKKDSKLMQYFLNQKVEPLKRHFDCIFYKGLTHAGEPEKNCVQLLISYGYNISYEEVLTVAALNVKIDDMENKFKFDEKYSEIVKLHRVNPYNITVGYTTEDLEKCLSDNKLSHYYREKEIRKIIATGVKANANCLNIYLYQRNVKRETLNLLVKNGATISDNAKANIKAKYVDGTYGKLVAIIEKLSKPKVEKVKVVKKIKAKKVEVEEEEEMAEEA